MTATEPPPDNAAEAVADRFFADLNAQAECFNKRMRRQRRVAGWFLIPYAGAGFAASWGIGRVMDAEGFGETVTLLWIGFIGLVCCQWIMPALMLFRRSPCEKENH